MTRRYLAQDLPALRTALIGRERDTAEIRALLLNEHARLITLTGMGGSGKTRLALELASGLGPHFPDGVWLVELARIADPHLVPEFVARTMGVPEVASGVASEALNAHLRQRSALVVLDNCEHLVVACARLVDDLLSACPHLYVLATSREPLKIAGERQRLLQPLALPNQDDARSPDVLGRCAAVQLFCERAAAVRPSFTLTAENGPAVARICALLEGLPLALELAAARVSVLSLGQILQRLDDCPRLLAGGGRSLPARQQTLKATLEWSYQLLSPDEQMAFRRLAIFPGEWSLEAAEAACEQDSLTRTDVLEVLVRLVEKSLVLVGDHPGDVRYRLLHPVRQWGERLLAEAGERAAAEARLRGYCLALVERAEPELRGPAQAEWLKRLDHEFDTIRACVRWAERAGDRETILRLGGALYWYFWLRRHLREGLRWLEDALAIDQPVPANVEARGYLAASVVSKLVGDLARSLTLGDRALVLFRRLDDAAGLTIAQRVMSHASLMLGDPERARYLAEQSVSFARVTKSRWQLAHALIVLGQVAYKQGEERKAIVLHEQAVALFRDHGDHWGLNYALATLAALHRQRADIVRAAALSDTRTCSEQGDYYVLAPVLEHLATSFGAGRIEWQVTLLAAAAALRRSHSAVMSTAERDYLERTLASARLHLGEGRFVSAWENGYALSPEELVGQITEGDLLESGARHLASPAQRYRGRDALTTREREIASLLAQGYKDREIAQALSITSGTTRQHVHHILDKLGLRSRFQIASLSIS